MKKESSHAFGLGLILAPFIAFLLFMLFSPENPSESNIIDYLKKSKEMVVDINKPMYFDGGMWAEKLVKGTDAKFYHRVSCYLDFRKNRYKEFAVFYSAKYKKYFVIESYNNSLQNLLNYENLQELNCMVNLNELRNSAFGTIKNPVPILWITKNLNLSEPINYQKYRYNVTEYLRFYKGRKNYDEGACAVCPY